MEKGHFIKSITKHITRVCYYQQGNFHMNKKHGRGQKYNAKTGQRKIQYWEYGNLIQEIEDSEEQKIEVQEQPKKVSELSINNLKFKDRNIKKCISILSQTLKSESEEQKQKVHLTIGFKNNSSGRFDSSNSGSNSHLYKSISQNSIIKWKKKDVIDWLNKLNLQEYVQTFEKHQIQGKHIFMLNQQHLKQMGISLGHRKNLLKSIEEKKEKNKVNQNKAVKRNSLNNILIKKESGCNKWNFLKNNIVKQKQTTQNITQETVQVQNKQDKLESSSNQDQSSQSDPQQQKVSHNIEKKVRQYLEKKGIQLNFIIEKKKIQIEKKIGQGASGKVYKGYWLGQEVAVKKYCRRVHNRHIGDFVEEVRHISRLTSPHIVLYMGMYIFKNEYAMITQYLQKGSLYDHLHNKFTPINQQRMISIVEDIALGMIYLHGKNVLHCDLKSSNVLVKIDYQVDQNWNVKLCDFGLSQNIFKSIMKKRRIGTPNWMAPEVMRGQTYKIKSDIYSFGVIIWELLTRLIPYENLSVTQIIATVGYHGNKLAIPTGNQFLVDLFKRCTESDEEKRPGQFKQIHEMIQKYQQQKKQQLETKYSMVSNLNQFFGIIENK